MPSYQNANSFAQGAATGVKFIGGIMDILGKGDGMERLRKDTKWQHYEEDRADKLARARLKREQEMTDADTKRERNTEKYNWDKEGRGLARKDTTAGYDEKEAVRTYNTNLRRIKEGMTKKELEVFNLLNAAEQEEAVARKLAAENKQATGSTDKKLLPMYGKAKEAKYRKDINAGASSDEQLISDRTIRGYTERKALANTAKAETISEGQDALTGEKLNTQTARTGEIVSRTDSRTELDSVKVSGLKDRLAEEMKRLQELTDGAVLKNQEGVEVAAEKAIQQTQLNIQELKRSILQTETLEKSTKEKGAREGLKTTAEGHKTDTAEINATKAQTGADMANDERTSRFRERDLKVASLEQTLAKTTTAAEKSAIALEIAELTKQDAIDQSQAKTEIVKERRGIARIDGRVAIAGEQYRKDQVKANSEAAGSRAAVVGNTLDYQEADRPTEEQRVRDGGLISTANRKKAESTSRITTLSEKDQIKIIELRRKKLEKEIKSATNAKTGKKLTFKDGTTATIPTLLKLYDQQYPAEDMQSLMDRLNNVKKPGFLERLFGGTKEEPALKEPGRPTFIDFVETMTGQRLDKAPAEAAKGGLQESGTVAPPPKKKAPVKAAPAKAKPKPAPKRLEGAPSLLDFMPDKKKTKANLKLGGVS